jgi:hypothetical protein
MIVPTKRTSALAGIAVAVVIAAGTLPIRSDSTAPMQGGHYKFTYMLTTAAAGAYQATAVTDGGTIKGSVVYTSTVPVKKIIPKDPEVCGKPHDEPQIVVGAGKGVKDAIVYLEGITKGKPMTSPAGAPEINNKNCQFVPESQVRQTHGNQRCTAEPGTAGYEGSSANGHREGGVRRTRPHARDDLCGG